MNTRSGLVQAACVMTMSAGFVNLASADDGRGRIQISTGAYITPLASPGSKSQLLKRRCRGIRIMLWITRRHRW
jgi:hypothetical protein